MKKIILIVPSLIRGGVERVVSVLSKELSKYYEVYVVIYHHPVEYEIGGKLINLETPTGSFWRKIKNTFYRVIKLKKLRSTMPWESPAVGPKKPGKASLPFQKMAFTT